MRAGKDCQLAIPPTPDDDFSFATGQQNGLARTEGLLGASRVALNLKLTRVAKHESVGILTKAENQLLLNGQVVAFQVAGR